LQPKSEKCIFVGYSEDVKGYRLLQPHCNEIIIRRDVKFDENLLAYEPNSMIVPSSAYEPSSTFVPSSVPILVSSSDDDSEDENPPPPAHLPPDESIEPEPTPTPRFLDGSIQHEKQLVILSVILQINVRHIHSSNEPLLFWLKFQRLMIQRHLQKLQVIQIGIQQ
jgi:hypothetical protein